MGNTRLATRRRGLAGFTLIGLCLAALLARAADAPPAPVPLPPVEAAQALAGGPLLEALRGGGFVLFLRHAQQTTGPQNDCSVSTLTAEGIAQAERFGDVLRRAAIAVDTPRSSPICRAVQTAKLLGLGEPVIEAALLPRVERESIEARDRLFATLPAPGRNILLVGHVVGGAPAKALRTERGGVIVFRPDGKGGSVPVAHVLPDAWAAWGEAPRR